MKKVILCSFLLFTSSCVSTFATFTKQGFKHETYPYKVFSLDGKVAGSLLSSNWKLDNFYFNGRVNKLVPKKGTDYEINYEFDTDNDGKTDFVQLGNLYDIRLKHRKSAGVIWLRTIPIQDDDFGTDLRVIAKEYVNAMAEAGYEVKKFGSGIVIKENKYVAKVNNSAKAKLAKLDAFESTIDVSNVDQIKVTPDKAQKRVSLVFVRTKFRYKSGSSSPRHYATFPVLMLIGYSNFPEDFEAQKKDFEIFLKQIEIQGNRGYQRIEETQPSQPPSQKTSNANQNNELQPKEEAPNGNQNELQPKEETPDTDQKSDQI